MVREVRERQQQLAGVQDSSLQYMQETRSLVESAIGSLGDGAMRVIKAEEDIKRLYKESHVKQSETTTRVQQHNQKLQTQLVMKEQECHSLLQKLNAQTVSITDEYVRQLQRKNAHLTEQKAFLMQRFMIAEEQNRFMNLRVRELAQVHGRGNTKFPPLDPRPNLFRAAAIAVTAAFVLLKLIRPTNVSFSLNGSTSSVFAKLKPYQTPGAVFPNTNEVSATRKKWETPLQVPVKRTAVSNNPPPKPSSTRATNFSRPGVKT